MDYENKLKLIEKFQCPGCIHGSDISCVEFCAKYGFFYCKKHKAGTFLGLGNEMFLGLPTGFDKVGENKPLIRIYEHIPPKWWDHLNVPVWAMEKEGFLFVKTYSPRINFIALDIIKDGTLDLVPNAIDVSKFIDEID